MVAGKAMLAILNMLVNATFARVLSKDDLGLFFLSFSLVNFFSIVCLLGMQQVLLRQVGGSAARKYLGAREIIIRTLAVVLSWGFLVSALFAFVIGCFYVPELFNAPSMIGLSFVIGIWIFLNTIRMYSDFLLRSLKRLHISAFFEKNTALALQLAAVFLLIALGVQLQLNTIIWIVAASIVATIILFLPYFVRLYKSLPNETTAENGSIRSIFLPLFGLTLLTAGAPEFHVWILGATGEHAQIAFYGLAARVGTLVAIPLFAMNSALAPYVAELMAAKRAEKAEEILRFSASVVMLVSVPATLILLIWGAQLLSLVFGPVYAEANVTLAIILLAQLVNVATGAPGVLMNMSDRQNLVFFIVGISIAFGVAVSLLTVHTMGSVGVAMGMGSGLALQNVVMWLYCWRVMGVRTHMTARLRVSDLRSMVSQIRCNRIENREGKNGIDER